MDYASRLRPFGLMLQLTWGSPRVPVGEELGPCAQQEAGQVWA
jgi:hypothetical protein